MRVVRRNGPLFGNQRSKICGMVRSMEDGSGAVRPVGRSKQVHQGNRRAMLVEQPDARPFGMKKLRAGFGDHTKRLLEFPAVEAFTLREFSQRVLVAAQEGRRIVGRRTWGAFLWRCRLCLDLRLPGGRWKRRARYASRGVAFLPSRGALMACHVRPESFLKMVR